ncbi:hypothetical protein HYFRA_00008957 [Hymenoscyphus fraxineus]|uniref:DUF7136 domain-containing protein n=1 Tax=Hymenoscyphus fraxineus TaxID=746836 RepID=A0A9N9KTM4_9HELO|nr:hypothetical protein HYFRA_00008957 [Hymenoscyphus fraxineus]
MISWAIWIRGAVFLQATAMAQQLPSTVELDIIFPRNETYQRQSSFPIIFAIQNAATAIPYGFWVQWTLQDLDHQNNTATHTLDHDTWQNTNLTASGAYLLATNTPEIQSSTAKKWSFNWSMGFHQNCTAGHAIVSSSPMSASGYEISGSMVFTVSAIGNTPDFLTSRCPEFGGAIGIKENLTTTRGEACPVLEEEPKGNPCGFLVDGSVVGDISARLNGSLVCAGNNGTCERLSSVGTFLKPRNMLLGVGMMVLGVLWG